MTKQEALSLVQTIANDAETNKHFRGVGVTRGLLDYPLWYVSLTWTEPFRLHHLTLTSLDDWREFQQQHP
jgi:hypothetical protein